MAAIRPGLIDIADTPISLLDEINLDKKKLDITVFDIFSES